MKDSRTKGSVDARSLDLPAVVGPMQQSLALAAPAIQIAGRAVFSNGGDVARDGAPTANLAFVVSGAPPHVVPAVPLKPTARVVRMDPAFSPPLAQRLRCVDAEVVKLGIVSLRAESCSHEPRRRKLVPAIRHIFAAEDAEMEHLLRRELRGKIQCEIAAGRLRTIVDVAALHRVVDDDPDPFRGRPQSLRQRLRTSERRA